MKFPVRASVLLLLGVGVSAATLANEKFYEEGVVAFQSGDYQSAVQAFESARQEGMQSATLHYNLGASYYRLGLYEASAREFIQIRADGKWGALAEYNLGLLAERQGNRAQAIQHYQQAYRNADSDRVKALALAKLDSFSSILETKSAHSKRWNFYLSAAGGYDDNPALTELDQTEAAADDSDTFIEALGVMSGYLYGNRQDGVRVNAGFYNRTYSDVSAFDVTGLYGGFYRDRQYGSWQGVYGLIADAYWVDGDSYTHSAGLHAQASRPLAIGELELQNQLSFIDAANTYGYLEGIRNRATISWLLGHEGLRWKLGYTNEYNDRDDINSDLSFESVSPVRHTLFGQMDHQISPRLTGTARAEYRDTRYRNANMVQDDQGNPLRLTRSEERLEMSLQARYSLHQTFGVFAEYRYVDNDSNIVRYAYESNQLMLGMDAAF